MSSTCKKVTDPTDPINKLLLEVETSRLGVVQAGSKILDELAKKGLVYKMPIHPRSVGFDPSNRDGEGGLASAVLELASAIAEVGWSWDECAHAVCAEVVPGDLSVENFNILISSDCGLAFVESHTILYGSLACGHANYVLRAIAAGVPSSCPYLSDNGNMSLQRVAARDPEYAGAVTNGLRWTVLRWPVRIMYPGVLSVIEKARNMAATILRRESELQGLMRLHSLSAGAQAMKREINWPAIKKSVLRSRPPYGEILNDMIAFLLARSGGVDGKYLKFLQAFSRTCVPAKRSALPGAVYSALADFPHQFFAIALVEAAFKCPANFVSSSGTCTWLSAGEVSSLGKTKDEKLKQKLQRAESLLSAARIILPQCGIHEDVNNCNKLVIALAKFDVAMVRYVTGKLAETKIKLTSFQDVGRIYVLSLREAFPEADLEVLMAQWAITKENLEASDPVIEDQAGPVMRLYDVDDQGRTVDPLAALRSESFDIGAVVTAIAGANLEASGRSPLLRVAAVRRTGEESVVQLTLYDLGLAGSKAASPKEIDAESVPLVVPFDTFFEEWVVTDPKTFVEEHAGWPAHRTSTTDTARSLFNKGAILFALGSAATLIDKSFDCSALAIFTKPVKKVVAKSSYAVGTVVLLPESTSLKIFKTEERPEDGAGVEVKLTGSMDETLYYLMPCTAEQNVAPLWFVATTEDPAKANVAWVEARMNGLCGVDFLGDVSADFLKTRNVKKAKKMSPEEAAAVDEDVVTQEVVIPVLVNFRPIEVGTELVVHRKRKSEKKKKKDPEAITVTSLAKRSKQ